jgi:hypothetical protein
MNWNWPWHRKRGDWQILPQDFRWNGFEGTFLFQGGWEPFAVSTVPNTLETNRLRVWTRRREGGEARRDRDYEINVRSAGWGGHQVPLHLIEGWEPFGVQDSYDNHIVWFRRAA